MTTYAERPWLKHYDAGVPHTLKPYPQRPLHSFLTESAQHAPDRTALITPTKLPLLGFQSHIITYRQLDRMSASFAAALVSMGMKKGDRVAIVLPNSAAFAICYFGILKAGGVVAATNPTYPPKRLAYQINDCDARFVVTLSLFYPTIKQIQPETKATTIIVTNIKEYLPSAARILFSLTREKKDGHRVEQLHPHDVWFQEILAQYDGQKPSVTVTSDDLGLFQYTGGTTGVSKGAMLTHGAMVANMLQIQAWSSVLGDDSTAAHFTAHGVRWTRVFAGNDLYELGFEDTPTITLVDGQGRTVRAMTLRDPTSATSAAMVETTYDALGNLIALERGAGELASEGSTSASFVTGQTTRRELLYDSLGRRKKRLEAWGVRLEAEISPSPNPHSELSRRHLAALYFQQPWTPRARGGRRALRGIALSQQKPSRSRSRSGRAERERRNQRAGVEALAATPGERREAIVIEHSDDGVRGGPARWRPPLQRRGQLLLNDRNL